MEYFNKFLANVEKENLQVLFAQVRKDGEIVADWSKFKVKSRYESYSSCKTFVAVAVGIAIDEHLITLDEKVSDSFKDESYDVINPYALDLTVKDMLTMTSGFEKPILFRDSFERSHEKDWIRYFYTHGNFVEKAGENFLYCNANTYMLGCLIEKKCGKNLLEYLRYRLFEPLEIGNPDWTICPNGHTVAANGLSINIDEMSRFGQMLLDGGVYKGKRIVSESFIKELMTPYVETNRAIVNNPSKNLDYGYQVWVDTENKCVFLWGIMGQYCVIVPEKNAVITVLSLDEKDNDIAIRIWEDIIKNL